MTSGRPSSGYRSDDARTSPTRCDSRIENAAASRADEVDALDDGPGLSFAMHRPDQTSWRLADCCDVRQQVRRSASKCGGQLADVRKADVSLATFDHSNVVAMQTSPLGKRFLGQLTSKAQPSEILAKLFCSVGHRGSNTTRFHRGLHTISRHTIDIHTIGVIHDRHVHDRSTSRHTWRRTFDAWDRFFLAPMFPRRDG